jgi:hypothetical protein
MKEEDNLLIAFDAGLGNKWAMMSAMLPGCTDKAVKNRCNSSLKRRTEWSGATYLTIMPGRDQESSHPGRQYQKPWRE